ncbi:MULTISPECIES: general secretion pathway protein GspB [unclassified Pseudoalteromonas]|uniref:general secretion pathway protein GspB n=1 Tax=unclassified Pseudoalteromonas TaxID=194690 RepID=UPI000C0700F8|nr:MULTISPECIES: general secretion pathway protein GspB [unclassified Pseudoalteromonas]MDP2633993.1 general secretion pathway protein GspB [Pseudoalteromonas sp. 1_MG-2023]PHN90773.1 general secretion pathway protein GspB [Pseudoalteromonas sp. 3D05]
MSFLLDALKQSEHHDEASAFDQNAQQIKQQQELKRYRLIAMSLALLLALALTLVAGFSIGKWFQTKSIPTDSASEPSLKELSATDEKVIQPNEDVSSVQKSSDTLPKNVPQEVQNAPAQFTNSQQPVMAQGYANQSQQYQWVQVPVNAVPTYSQGQTVLVQTPNGYQQVINAPTAQFQPQQYSQPQQYAQPQQFAQSQPINTRSRDIDLSQYKVLGKPIEQSNSANQIVPQRDDELETVPSELKNAFAQAIKDTETVTTNQVTQATRNSSYAEPIELLPDGLLALLPNIKYQAHIYSSSVEKRWIKLNNRELYEGDSLDDIEVLEITPEQSVLSFDGYQFSIKALQDWPE